VGGGGYSFGLQAVKCFSKSRLLKKRDMVGGGLKARVVTALDKVQSEILVMQRLGDHPNIVPLYAVLTQSSSDDLYLGAFSLEWECSQGLDAAAQLVNTPFTSRRCSAQVR